MCPDCGRMKMLFETEKKAENFIKFNGEEICDDPSTLRVYYCPGCAGYHISSKPHKKSYDHSTDKLIERFHLAEAQDARAHKIMDEIKADVDRFENRNDFKRYLNGHYRDLNDRERGLIYHYMYMHYSLNK